MQRYDWPMFLHDWNETLLAHARESDDLDDLAGDEDSPPEQVFSTWLGYPGASEQQVYDLEQRLQTRLPPSYRSFLFASNGFRQPGNEATDLTGLLAILAHGDEHQQKLAIDALGNLRDLRAFEPIAHILADPEADLFVREYAARSIGMLHDSRSAPLLIEVYRQPMSTNEITTTIIKSAQPPFAGTVIPSMPLNEFLSQANNMFTTSLNVTAVSNGMSEHLRHAIRQGLFELGTFVMPPLEQARYDSSPQIRALAEEVLNYVAR